MILFDPETVYIDWRHSSSVKLFIEFSRNEKFCFGKIEKFTALYYIFQRGIRSLGFSPINNTPVLLHAHNEYITEEGFLHGVMIYEKLIEKLANLPG